MHYSYVITGKEALMLLFLTGLFIGSIAGMALAALMVTAKKRDELRDRSY